VSVWLCIPSKRPPAEALPLLNMWTLRGYRVALFRDHSDLQIGTQFGPGGSFPPDPIIEMVDLRYPGYAQAVNLLADTILRNDPACDWIVIGGDDVEPDLAHTADEIAFECTRHFSGTFGIMQPIGHKWGDRQGPYIERVCGSAWIGREWCQRANQGRGPLFPEFEHMFVDQALQEVAVHLGVLWQHEGLNQIHRHWGLPKPGERLAPRDRMPAFLEKWNTPEHWNKSKTILDRLRKNGFKECLPI
jgi:hypothetical protein